jgi:allophanate hydrolase subunit 2
MKSEIVCGLPWLYTKPERAIFSELGFACVYAVGPTGGRPLRIGWSKQLKDRMKELQLGCWKELQIHDIIWTAGDMLAIRIFNEAVAVLDKAKRRLTGDWFDVTPESARQAIRLASDKLTIPTFSQGDMLQKVRAIRRSRIDAAVRVAS